MTPSNAGFSGLSRREFLQWATAMGFGALARQVIGSESEPVNPLEGVPDRAWEKVYRDLLTPDSSFVFLCAPNDTHNCLLRAYVKNGVIVRIGPTFGYGQATDAYGTRSSHRWDPRCCQKGLALTRRFYGDRRVRGPRVRLGWKRWVEQGHPRDAATGAPPREFFHRGRDKWVSVSWDEAIDLVARTFINIAKTYQGPEGASRLQAQGYDPEMIEAMRGAGTQVLKFRGGMPLLGLVRVFGMYRLANSLALVDSKLRGVGPDQALGGRGWDNYSWHTDLPPGHPMVTGQQTVDFDLHAVEHARTVVVWGMNWVTTKMPDAHWLTEARAKGTHVVVIACEYSATNNKADEFIVVRPGTTPALALGLCGVLFRERLYDEGFVRRFTDLVLLVRQDNLRLLRAADVIPGYRNAALSNATRVLKPDEKPPAPGRQVEQLIPAALRETWGDFMVWDRRRGRPQPLTRDQVGEHFDRTGLDPALEGEFTVQLADGQPVRVQPLFDVIRRYVVETFDLEATEQLTWAPRGAVEALARRLARHPGTTLFALGMGPNQFFNNDLKDRAVFLLAALTGNVGRIGGNVGSFAGNYRVALFNGLPQYMAEDPFDIELAPSRPARVRLCWRAESAHYYNHEDHMLKVGGRSYTGRSHVPTPTKAVWFANANSILGNVKWHYNVVHHVLPKFEMIAVNEWWWSTSCEYADVVFAVDSWAEMKLPEQCCSVTNPFLTVYPQTPLERLHDTLGDVEVQARVAQRIGEILGEPRLTDYWKFVHDRRVAVYHQRIMDASNLVRGFDFEELHRRAQQGIPALMMNRTLPRAVGYEQTELSQPWYTKTGRLEFYREEPEFIEQGENLPVYREPIDATFHEPNVIVSAGSAYLRPRGPEQAGLRPDDQSTETRQVRNVVRTWKEVVASRHPLADQGYRFIFHTPKYRHGAHTTPIDTDLIAVLFGPFGDLTRHDKRQPFVSEGYVDIHPEDARALGIQDGDYVWIDSDPSDRPYRGWKPEDPDYAVSRLLCRARYYPGTPRGVTRMWFNMYAATPGSVLGAATRPDGLAKNPETHYQAMFRSGSHQSATRGWLKPTHMTDSLVRKEVFGQVIGQGFAPDVHCPTGAPRESIVRITRAEPGGADGRSAWRPVLLGLRPTVESTAFQTYLRGGYIQARS